MMYELSSNQFHKLWSKHNDLHVGYEVSTRIKYWDQHLKEKFQLEYKESTLTQIREGGYPEAWYGLLVGNEKDINWFILLL